MTTPVPQPASPFALSTHALSVHLPQRSAPILDRVHLEVPRQSIMALLGASGAGKSTLLRAIAGLCACEGEVRIEGTDVSRHPPHARALGFAFDDALLHEHLSVRENIDSARIPYSTQCGESAALRGIAVEAIAQELEITPLLDRAVPTLSSGERRRCAIARALIRQGSVVLLDEPFANLDRPLRLALRQSIRTSLAHRNSAAIIATHDITDALAIATHIAVLVQSQLRQCALTADLLARPCDSAVAALLGDDAPCIAPVTLDGRTQFLGVRPNDWLIPPTASTSSHRAIALRLHDLEPAALGAELIATHIEHAPKEGIFRVRLPLLEARQLLRVGHCSAFVDPHTALVFGDSQSTKWGARPLLGSIFELAPML